jgi:hypothetical protein
MQSSDKKKDDNSSYEWIKGFIYFIGLLGLGLIVYEGIGASFDWFFELPWYFSVPLGIAIVITVRNYGRSKRWW